MHGFIKTSLANGAEREYKRPAEVQLRLCYGHHRKLPRYCYSIMAFAISFGDKNNGLQAGIIDGTVEFHPPPGTLRGCLKPAGPSEH